MSTLPFLPVIDAWFRDRFSTPTPAQAEAWPAIRRGEHVLLAAPTGSGKTLAAFLSAIDELIRRAQGPGLPDETKVLYISPLKALSRDIEYNLRGPLAEIAGRIAASGAAPVTLRTAVRTGDTPARERAALLKTPPHLLVTTPESLYLLLTSAGGRRTLEHVETVIVDEIHATVGSKRGAHLALSLERLDDLLYKRSGARCQRIGLSATQNPISEVARFLVGTEGGRARACTIVDQGHGRTLDLEISLTGSPLEAVMSAEAQGELYDQLAELTRAHRSTLIFTNTRKATERITRFLAERIGSDQVTSHHGSLSKALRESAEGRLREGRLRALVATASLELGIDIGDVDLVCQVGSPGSVAALLQRVGRSGHARNKTPKGRLFPQSRDDLIECIALIDCVRRGELDSVRLCGGALDILAQQIIARLADSSSTQDELFALVRRAAPYSQLTREQFEQVVEMVSQGFVTRRGRRGALVHLDETTSRVRGRRGARLAALTSGGAIPDSFDYEVLLSPTDTRVGTLNEDFAIESSAGDIFQLGNVSYQILKIEPGIVRVRDAEGALPNLPFWLGEAPSRSDALSVSVSRLRSRVAQLLDDSGFAVELSAERLAGELGISREVASAATAYLGQNQIALGRMPTQATVVAERFFDETGSMHVVIHSTFGMRQNRAFALALRKRFCRSFNVELQAAASEDAILLSLGPMHSFPLQDLWQFVRARSAREVLTQALLDSPLFQTRFRWNATRSLAVLRFGGGKKKPPRFQRLEADDLLALCFPDQVACQENLSGEREIPDHPLVTQTIEDCLTEAMDVEGLLLLLEKMERGEIELVARDVTEPSLFAHEILTAKPYTFLDDAPLEERRAQAVILRRQGLAETASDLGQLDPTAILAVCQEAEPDPRDPDELSDALSIFVFATRTEIARWEHAAGCPLAAPLLEAGRACELLVRGEGFLTVRRFESVLARALEGEPDALREACRGRLEWSGPTTVRELAELLRLPDAAVHQALLLLVSEGFVLQGHFRTSAGSDQSEFCERRLLARIHRKTIGRLRQQIAPVSPAAFVHFLCQFQGITRDHRRRGPEGTWATIEQLAGFSAPAGAWESSILPLRVTDYSPAYLDQLTLMGRVTWRATREGGRRLTRSTPLVFDERTARPPSPSPAPPADRLAQCGADARRVAAVLERRGASFFSELTRESGLLPSQGERAVSELAARGICTTDGISGLRTLIASEAVLRRTDGTPGRSRGRRPLGGPLGLQWAGRIDFAPQPRPWQPPENSADAQTREDELFAVAWRLLRRWGVVFRQLLTRESQLPPWRELLRAYFRLEARGEVRGGRFVSGFSGEQFALPEAVAPLRRGSNREFAEALSVSPSDPLNLIGVLTPDALVNRAKKGLLRIVGGEFLPEVPLRPAAGDRRNHAFGATSLEPARGALASGARSSQ